MSNHSDDIKREIVKKSKYILFLSVDIVGSTEYKQKNSWGNIFDTFYEQFNASFMDSLSNCNLVDPDNNIPKPEFWKYLGDEVIYKVIIEDKKDLAYYLDSFKRALNDIRKKQFENINLDLKATAWTAGFPLKNSIIKTKIPFDKNMLVDKNNNIEKINTNNNHLLYNLVDYIGPSMDVGFRITKFSSKNKFIIGRSLTILLLESGVTESFKIKFDGNKFIKGIEDLYPIIWIDMQSDESKTKEDELIGKQLVNTNTLKEYLTSGIDDKNKPYVINDINSISDEYLESYRKKFKSDTIINDTSTNGKPIEIEINGID